ncbi:MAG: AzlD domain-containing protein [Candidatus Izemoplasmatales bacterium]|jgi:branched-subunit amino acid transport protein AzlD|nr:AzlD domain-containing protein [Candidatus Izemoplasmatales bacterium]
MISFWIVVTATLATMLTRFLPLVLNEVFKKTKWLDYLSKVLPMASFGLLVVYSLQHLSFVSSPYGIPEVICLGLVILLQLKFNNILLSIFGPTFVYIILMNFILI